MTRKILLTLTTIILATAAAAAEPHLVEGIVVRVNDRILTTTDIRDRANERAAETGKPVTPDQYPEMIQEAADEMCMLERANELKLEVSSEELNAAIQQLREQNHVPDDAAFEKTLHDLGLTLEGLRARVRDNILVSRLLKHELGDLPITEAELRQRFEREKDKFTDRGAGAPRAHRDAGRAPTRATRRPRWPRPAVWWPRPGPAAISRPWCSRRSRPAAEPAATSAPCSSPTCAPRSATRSRS